MREFKVGDKVRTVDGLDDYGVGVITSVREPRGFNVDVMFPGRNAMAYKPEELAHVPHYMTYTKTIEQDAMQVTVTVRVDTHHTIYTDALDAGYSFSQQVADAASTLHNLPFHAAYGE